MKLKRFGVVGALVMTAALSTGVMPVEAAQRDSQGRDRNGRQSQGRIQQRSSGSGRESATATPAERPQGQQGRAAQAAPVPQTPPAASRQYAVPRPVTPAPPSARSYGYNNDRYRAYGYPAYRYPAPAYRYPAPAYHYPAPAYPYYGRYYAYRAYPRSYYPAVPVVPVPVPVYPVPHYYGPGGHFSVSFGWGNGYLYGAPYSGRVYGYTDPQVSAPDSGGGVYYGDVRLQVTPRDAAVYVDGYYAGIVDDFDGAFQRLTLQVGPHRIELNVEGSEPRFFDVYVDQARTVAIHADLFR